MPESRRSTNPASAALIAGLLVLPFLAANAIVSNRIEPFFSLIRPGPHTSAFEYLLLVFVLGCIPVGAFIAAQPLLQRGVEAKRRFYLLSGLIAACMLILFVFLVIGLGTEIYRCEVLRIPNCD